MRSSKFSLHPAGDTPSSCRLFDAIVSHCVPVIVSDQIELPFEDEIDYTQFSLFFSFKEALEPGYMVNQLRKFPKEKWMEMWKQIKNITHHFEFQYPPKKEDMLSICYGDKWSTSFRGSSLLHIEVGGWKFQTGGGGEDDFRSLLVLYSQNHIPYCVTPSSVNN